MERNTFPVSTYIDAPHDLVYEYLADLGNLDEWTLFSRMKEKVDDDTWLGTASAYQSSLYYHIERNAECLFKSIEWHCGIERGKYYQVYPTYLIRPGYLEPASDEPGVYFHWVSFLDPSRRTAMLEQALDPIHASECRSLKSVLERRAGRTRPTAGRHRIRTATIYVDAPVELAQQYLTDLQNVPTWTHRLLPRGEGRSEAAEFVDEYNRAVTVSARAHRQPSYIIIELDTRYLDDDFVQRSPMLLFPCSYVFADAGARGFILHRLTFWRNGDPPHACGKVQLDDYHAENINIKRLLEGISGNAATFARGTSYLPGR